MVGVVAVGDMAGVVAVGDMAGVAVGDVVGVDTVGVSSFNEKLFALIYSTFLGWYSGCNWYYGGCYY
jgi:hypothetical protein